MKKQKKLNLGKIKIAGVNIINSLVGGVTTHCPTGDQPHEPTCTCANSFECDTYKYCPTTIKTVSESDVCGGDGETRDHAIC
ncbi:hypothetical protein H2O64_01060 [Kordia sp. YSTF-M3]|uniref:Bacteriocin n=1 Tax=Kordia aestuariivivens TaxID=2759037 RepID=A0ABR7Q3Y3_9FLAO|nr:hypothetical protein [Kordia aestuariivivens]MBC8753238.1 hypothetical protein [Kordia aestuariivivens]